MKLGMTLLVKNEIDIIKYHIEYHKDKMDAIVVIDNNSTDGTYEYLKSLESNNFVVKRELSNNYLQDKWVTKMVFMLRDMGCDWVVNSDADEFWRGNIFREVDNLWNQGYEYLFVKSYVFKPTYLDNQRDKNPTTRLLWRSRCHETYPKVIVATGPFERIGKGNDEAFFCRNVEKKVIDECIIYHYSQRGLEHYKKKYLDGGVAIENSIKSGEIWNSQWTVPYGIFKNEGEEAFIKYWSDNYYCSDEEKIKQWDLVFDDNIKKEQSMD